MRFTLLANTGIRISKVGLGTAAFGVAPLAEDADALVGAALDMGVNLFDTANSYGNQSRFDRGKAPPAKERESAEEILGRALGVRRHEVILCSKVCEPVGPGPNDFGLSRRHIFSQIEATLKRLDTDYIDIYHAHHPDRDTPIEETIRAFDDLIRQGKIRYFALSTFSAWEMTEALWVCDKLNCNPPIINQLSYSLANRSIEADLIPACRRFGVTVTVFSPLGGGLLAGKDTLNRSVSGAERWGYSGFSEQQLELASQFNAVAEEWKIPPAPLAIAWVMSSPVIGAALVGPESAEELSAITVGADIELDEALLERLNEIGRPEPRNWY